MATGSCGLGRAGRGRIWLAGAGYIAPGGRRGQRRRRGRRGQSAGYPEAGEHADAHAIADAHAATDAGSAPDGNWIVNGSFEGDHNWTNIVTGYGNLVNQEPNGWKLSWIAVGQPLYDPHRPGDIAGGVAESLHKNTQTLPPDEWAGEPGALILEGTQVYKTFHAGTSFGTELRQSIENLPRGRYRLTMPVNLIWHENLDPSGVGWDHETAESAAFVFIDGVRYGRWVNALEMGDRTWYYHQVEFNVPAGSDVEVVLQFKSRYAKKDFFIDAVRLEAID